MKWLIIESLIFKNKAMKNLAIIVLFLLAWISVSCEPDPVIVGENNSEETGVFEVPVSSKFTPQIVSVANIVDPINGFVKVGESELTRKEDGLLVNFKTTGLTPGYTYTLWWLIWNNPEACTIPNYCRDLDFSNAASTQPDMMYAAGHVVGKNGKGNFSGYLRVGDDSTSINDLFGFPDAGGLQQGKTFSSEVHLLLRSHGPAIPGLVNVQINTFDGGCDDPFAIPPFTEIPDEIGECSEIQAAIHSPVS